MLTNLNSHTWLVATVLDRATLKIHLLKLSEGLFGLQGFITDITHNPGRPWVNLSDALEGLTG